MHPSLAFPALMVVVALQIAPRQDAQSILATVASKQAERWAAVENYAVEQTVEGAPIVVPIYYESGPCR